jgi:uncharacterized protein YukE
MSQAHQTTSIQSGTQLTSNLPKYANESDPSWEEVIAMVVIPGQPEAIRAAAGSWEMLLRGVQQVQTGLSDLSTGLQSWEGSAGEAYRGHLAELTKGLGEITEVHGSVPANLNKAADSVDKALSKIPIPDDLLHEALAARAKFAATGQLDNQFHPGYFSDLLFPGFMDLAGQIFGFLTFGLSDKASDMLRDFLTDGDEKAKAAYHELNGEHVGTQTSMEQNAQGKYDTLETVANPDFSSVARTAPPSSGPGMGNGTALQSSGIGGPIPNVPSTGPGGLGPIGGGGGGAGTGGLGAGGGGVGGIGGGAGGRPGGMTSAAGAIRGGAGALGGMAGAGGGARGTGAAGVRAGGVGGAGGAKAGGMGGMPMGGAAGGAGGGKAGAGGSRTGVPGVAAAKAGGAAGAGGRGMGPMMGGGAHGGDAGDATDHSTWLQEDEDVWGTDSDAAPPVLGS